MPYISFHPFSRAASIRFVHTDGSAHAHRARASPSGLDLSSQTTVERFLSVLPVLYESIFLHPFAPRPLRRFNTTMDALTPARFGSSGAQGTMNTDLTPHRSPCFTHIAFQPFRLQPPNSPLSSLLLVTGTPLFLPSHCWQGACASARQTVPGFAIESQARRIYLAESSSSSYGLVVHLPLLSTPSRDDAVTVDYSYVTLLWSGLAPL